MSMRSAGSRPGGESQSLIQDALLGNQARSASADENWRQSFPEIIGRSTAIQKVLETVSKVSRSDSAVLILGDSGTGKELIASAIHRLSPRSHKPFIAINCSAIPETLLESELFGHEKGAFTGADKRRIGQFEAANGGTIFLDEIGDMAPSLQAKLLRVLQDKQFTPLGSNSTKEADVRIVAATNKNLELAHKRGQFRLDLYYRLNVLPIVLPPLNERVDDVPLLLEHFIEVANRVQQVSTPCFLSNDLIKALCSYSWPGNIRQLINLVERLVVMKGGGKIDLEDLPEELAEEIAKSGLMEKPSYTPPVHSPVLASQKVTYPTNFGQLPSQGLDLVSFIEGLENDLILQALERTGNNKNQAAKLLGLNRTTLVERIKKRKIQPLNAPSKEL